MDESRTWGDVWNEIKSPGFWWWIAFQTILLTGLAAVNKWLIHIPGFPKW